MTAKSPSSSAIFGRGRFSTSPRACRSRLASTAARAPAGVSSAATSSSVRYCGTSRLLRDEADLAVGLEHGPLDVVERLERLLPRLGGELVDRHPLAPQVLLDR